MNKDQKQQAQEFIADWKSEDGWDCAGDQMAALLQELIDAPEPEPVGYTNETALVYVRQYEALPVSGVFWPTSAADANIALYTAPPAPSVPDWLETTQFLTDVTIAAGLLAYGRRDKGLAQRISEFAFKYRMLAAAPAAPERPRAAMSEKGQS